MALGDITDEQWEEISPLLPPERGRWARPAYDNRICLNGILWVLRMGVTWRDLPERYGKWNSVYVRFQRWGQQGVWGAVLESLVTLGFTDDWEPVTKSSIAQPSSQAGAKKNDFSKEGLIKAAAVMRARLGRPTIATPVSPTPRRRKKADAFRTAKPQGAKQRLAKLDDRERPAPGPEHQTSADTSRRAAPQELKSTGRRTTKKAAPKPSWGTIAEFDDPERLQRRFEQLVRRAGSPRRNRSGPGDPLVGG